MSELDDIIAENEKRRAARYREQAEAEQIAREIRDPAGVEAERKANQEMIDNLERLGFQRAQDDGTTT